MSTRKVFILDKSRALGGAYYTTGQIPRFITAEIDETHDTPAPRTVGFEDLTLRYDASSHANDCHFRRDHRNERPTSQKGSALPNQRGAENKGENSTCSSKNADSWFLKADD